MLQEAGTITADAVVKDTTTQAFVKDVIEESKRQPVFVDFWAPWCGPCKQLTPVLEKAVKAAKGKVKLVKMNIDDHPAIPGQLGIQSIPAVIAFVNGQPADGFMGALPESQVVAFLERLTKDRIGGEAQDLSKAADAALAESDAAGAAQMYADVLAEDNTSVPALSGLARAYVETGALDQARQTLAMVPEAKQNDCRRGRGPRRARACRAGQDARPGRRSSSRRSPPIRSTIRRASIWRWRSTARAAAPMRSSICSRSCGATANGTRTAPASSWCSFSRPGVRPTRPRSTGASGCRRSCSRSAARSICLRAAEWESDMPMNAATEGPMPCPR